MLNKTIFFVHFVTLTVNAFVPPKQTTSSLQSTRLFSSPQEEEVLDDAAIQWELFNKHHAKGSWKGIWTSYDMLGDVIDETVASVDLNAKSDNLIEHTHTIVVGAKRSDCATCFDSMEQKVLPVAQYTPDNVLCRSRFAGVSMINGPSILRSGAMATELVLRHEDGRVRVTFQHAPVWEKGIEPGSCPPQGLKLFRAMVSREALRSTAPTAETEGKDPPSEGNPMFFRPVPPFNWHKKWAGTSWTWGPSAGNRGWGIDELEEADAWQGITPVELWNLRLPGGVFVSAPRIVTDDSAGICRLAWLPDDETLLRVEAGIQALQPMVVEDDMMVGFEPPSLVSLRCDMLKKTGELENVFKPSRDLNNIEEEQVDTEQQSSKKENQDDSQDESSASKTAVEPNNKTNNLDEGDSSKPIRDSLSL